MQYNERYIEIYRNVLCNSHAMSATAIAVLAVMGREPSKRWKPKDMELALGISYMAASNAIKRLKLEGFVTNGGVVEEIGLYVAGCGAANVTKP